METRNETFYTRHDTKFHSNMYSNILLGFSRISGRWLAVGLVKNHFLLFLTLSFSFSVRLTHSFSVYCNATWRIYFGSNLLYCTHLLEVNNEKSIQFDLI
jgi:hypothetical protein